MKKLIIALFIFIWIWTIQNTFADFSIGEGCDSLFTKQEKTQIYKELLWNILKSDQKVLDKLNQNSENAKTQKELCRIDLLRRFCPSWVQYPDNICAIATKIKNNVYRISFEWWEYIWEDQLVIDNIGNLQNMSSLKIDLPQKIIIGNIWLDKPVINYSNANNIGWYWLDNFDMIHTTFNSKNIYDTILKIFESHIILRDSFIFSYNFDKKIVHVKYSVNYPFKNKLWITASHVFGGWYYVIGNKKNSLDSKVKKPTPITGANLSQWILNRYFGPEYIWTTEYYEEWSAVAKITKWMLPLFWYFPINQDFSILYIANPKYRVFDPDWLGKPVIYVYDNKWIENKVTVKTDWKFTLTIPSFTDWTTWNFIWNEDGSVNVKWNNYPYLRYKLAYNWYNYNNYWWFVNGKNIKKFFDDKLTKIWLNVKEKKDFEEYRVEKYKSDKEYFVSFKFTNQLEKYISLQREKKPDTILRVMMETTQINNVNDKKNFVIANDNVLPNYKRWWNYDVVERWWTMRADGNETIFWK